MIGNATGSCVPTIFAPEVNTLPRQTAQFPKTLAEPYVDRHHAGVLLEPPAAQVLRALHWRQPANRYRGAGTHQATLRYRGRDPRPAARGAAGPDALGLRKKTDLSRSRGGAAAPLTIEQLGLGPIGVLSTWARLLRSDATLGCLGPRLGAFCKNCAKSTQGHGAYQEPVEVCFAPRVHNAQAPSRLHADTQGDV